jgi:hypothetical protein
MNNDTSYVKCTISFISSSVLLLDASGGRIAREIWWMNQEFCPVIPPRFSVLIYHLWDEQYFWPQLRDILDYHYTELIIIINIIASAWCMSLCELNQYLSNPNTGCACYFSAKRLSMLPNHSFFFSCKRVKLS